MKNNKILYSLIFALALFISCSDSATGPENGGEEKPPPSESHAPNVSGVIIYRINNLNKAELFIVNADGTGKVQLTQNDVQDTDADFNPATSEIVYVEASPKFSGGEAVWKMNADGSNKVQLSDYAFDVYNPVWKPDGSKILFSTNIYIAVMNPDGSNLTKIYDLGFPTPDNKDLEGGGAIWSPDGTQILFYLKENGIENLYMMDNDGANITKITNLTSESVRVKNYSFNSDGTKISFLTSTNSKNTINTINVNGTNLNQIIVSDYRIHGLSNHPNTDKILFMGNISDNSSKLHPEIANFDGSNVHDFVPGSVQIPRTPVWSPTGDCVAFASGKEFTNKNYNNVIWLVKPDGSGLFKLESTLIKDDPITHIKWYKKN